MVAIVGLGTFLYAAWRWGGRIIRKVWRLFTRYRPNVPRETLRILPQMGEQWWHMGSIAGQPAMQMVSRWYATNITDDPVLILGARLVRPWRARAEDFFVLGGFCTNPRIGALRSAGDDSSRQHITHTGLNSLSIVV